MKASKIYRQYRRKTKKKQASHIFMTFHRIFNESNLWLSEGFSVGLCRSFCTRECPCVFSLTSLCPLRFQHKMMFDSSLFPFGLQGNIVLFMLFAFIYVWWCLSRYLYQLKFMSSYNNMTSVTSGAGSIYHSGPHNHISSPWFVVESMLLNL